MPGARRSVAATALSSAARTTPTTIGSSPRDLNATPSAHAIRIGNTKTQNSASGSRTNSRSRASVSSTSGG